MSRTFASQIINKCLECKQPIWDLDQKTRSRKRHPDCQRIHHKKLQRLWARKNMGRMKNGS